MHRDDEPRPAEVFWGEMSACEHFLQVYEDEDVFLARLEDYVADGVHAGDATIVIATAAHLCALEERFRGRGIDLVAARWRNLYIPLDAEQMLGRFMVNGWPDADRFREAVTSVLMLGKQRGRRVRAFGEMVALLWAQGHHGATVCLEHLWQDLCRSESLSLFCAYPKAGFTKDCADSLAEICALHSRVIDSGEARSAA